MGGHGNRVNTDDLKLLANDMAAQQWPTTSTEAGPADSLPLAHDAVANLNENAKVLQQYQDCARAESEHLHQSLTTAADAYAAVDQKYRDRLDDPGRAADIEAINLPAPSTAMPPIPGGPSTKLLDPGGYSDIEATQAQLASGDHGAALSTAAVQWGLTADQLQTNAVGQRTAQGWEGEAADAAYTRINSYTEFLHELSDAWRRLGQSAEQVHRAHATAFTEHTELYTQLSLIHI